MTTEIFTRLIRSKFQRGNTWWSPLGKKWAVVSFLSDELVYNLADTRSLFPNTGNKWLTTGEVHTCLSDIYALKH